MSQTQWSQCSLTTAIAHEEWVSVRRAIPELQAHSKTGFEMVTHTGIAVLFLLRLWAELSDSFPTTKIRELFKALGGRKRKQHTSWQKGYFEKKKSLSSHTATATAEATQQPSKLLWISGWRWALSEKERPEQKYQEAESRESDTFLLKSSTGKHGYMATVREQTPLHRCWAQCFRHYWNALRDGGDAASHKSPYRMKAL